MGETTVLNLKSQSHSFKGIPMAQFDDVTVPISPNGWLNLHTALSITAGTALILQNTGGPKDPTIRVATGSVAPSSLEDFGTQIHPNQNDQLISTPPGVEETFVISDTQSAEGKLSVAT